MARARLDQALVELKLAPSRSKAQQLIDAGHVEIRKNSEWVPATQASLQVDFLVDNIRIREESEILKYVSRGGLKLEGALRRLRLDVRGRRCLDLGVSTGGFADVLLREGASAVCGIDVGHGQLHPSLQNKIELIEGLNIKDAHEDARLKRWLAEGVDLCVADLSFISLVSLAPVIRRLLPAGTPFLGLVKPQFELGAAALNRAGVVADSELYAPLEKKVRLEFNASDYFASAVKGQDGNQEFFVYSEDLGRTS